MLLTNEEAFILWFDVSFMCLKPCIIYKGNPLYEVML